MRYPCASAFLTVLCFAAFAIPAAAQSWPGHHAHHGLPGYGGYGDYGGDGAWGLYASAMNNVATRKIAEADRLAGQRAAMQQAAAFQNESRAMLSSQAQARTQSEQGARQSYRDWWFQVEKQQFAQRPRSGAPTSAPVGGFEAASFAAPPSAASTSIIKWLPVLCDPQFAADRAVVEAPYRRQPKADPTAADYRNMIEAAQRMKATLGRMTAQISAQEYLAAEKFLDQLAAEAAARIEKAKSPAQPSDKP